MKKWVKVLIIAAVVVIIVAVISANTFTEVPTGNTGVVMTFGKVEEFVLDEGLHFKLPWQTVIKMDNRAQKKQITLQAFSSDIQQVDVIASVNYSVDRATSQNLYREVGQFYYDTVMEPRILENIKAVFTKYSAENLVANRENISREVAELLAPEIKTYGIELLNVSIENIDFTDVFTDAVENKQVAEQSKLQAEIEQAQKVMEAKSEAERQEISATAAANIAKIKADADAYAVEVAAKAEAEANEKVAASITDKLLSYTEINQWDGILPIVYSGDGTLPILDMRGLVGNTAE